VSEPPSWLTTSGKHTHNSKLHPRWQAQAASFMFKLVQIEWGQRVRGIVSRPLGGGAVWPQCQRCARWAVSAVALGEGVSWGGGSRSSSI